MVKENFFDDLLFFDKHRISDRIFNMLTDIVQFETFHPSFIANSSKAAAGLCAWIIAIYEYAKIVREQNIALEQIRAYEVLLEKVMATT